MCDGEIELSDRAKSLWGKTNRVDDTEWLPLYVHMADSAAMAARIWDTWVPYGTKSIISRDLGNDDDLARKLMIFLAGVHDIGKATPVFQAKPISFGPDAESLVWKPEQAGLPMIAGLRDTSHPTHPIAGQVILERYFSLVHKWGGRESRQYACVVGGHHGTPPDKSKLESARLGKTESGLDSEVWKTTQNELIEFIAGTVGMGDEEWELLSKKRFSAQSAVLATGLVIMADWIASDSDADMFPLVRVHPLWEDEESFGMTEREYDDIQSWSGLKRRAERAWACVQLPHAWEPADIPSSCQDLFSTRFRLPEGAHPRPVQEQAVRVARNTDTPGLLIIEAPMGEGKTEAALAAAEILAQRTGRGGICVALPTMATTDAMFSRVHRWLDALPSRDSTDEKTVWLAHGKAKLNDDFQGIIAASRRHFSSLSQDDTDEPYSRKHGEIPPETVISDWLWGRKKGALANFLVCTVDQVLMGALQMKHVVLRQLAMANKVVIVDECHAYDAYMREYLKMALEWLGSTRTPVILLSATLPESQREEMAEAYLKGWKNSKLELPSEAKHGGIRELKRRQLAAKTEKVCVNAPKLVQEKENSSARNVSSAYPVLTYTSDTEIKHMDVKPSGRSMNVRCQIVDDSDEALISLLDRLLENGGCVGVICDTVGRAQHAAKLLGDYFGSEYVKLTHSRFMDIDRMSNEAELRQLLGPDSTVGNGGRPQRMIVVGTQVLEQSLDIDFDALVTDIAPVDLIMQRLQKHLHNKPIRRKIMFVDIHCLQQVPPSNINRDDTGSPKTAYVGGALRARVSSQSWKRAMREMFGSKLDSSKMGKRTKSAVALISNAIAEKRLDLAEEANNLAEKVLTATGVKVKASDRAGADKGSAATEYLIFIANREVEQLADIAIAAFDEGKDPSKLKKEVAAVFHGKQAIDIACFGRMLADAPDLNTDASAQVAHAFSIDQITPEYDYFTAVDDCASDDNAGAAMIDTVGFNSSTLYRYATLNVDALRDQLQDADAMVEGVSAFVEAFVKSMPSGKQNTFANHTLPEDIVIVLRDSQPISAADAFENPIKRKDGISVSRQGIERLGDRLNEIRINYGEEPVKAWHVVSGGSVPSLDEWSEQVTLPELEQSLRETLSAAYSA